MPRFCRLLTALTLFLSLGWAHAQGETVITASHPLAAEAGATILHQGGNAVDAAAAVQFALNVVEPQSSGIGGGAFILVYLAKTHETLVIDAREVAPAAATADQFAHHTFGENSVNGIAVGVPGTLAGFAEAQRRWGKKSLAAVLQPAIGLARQGFAVTPYLAHELASPRAALQPETRALFRNGAGQPLQVGDWLRQPDLARTFEQIAAEGPGVFYQGKIAGAIVAAQRRSTLGPAGVGRMTLADLAGYRVALRTPLIGRYQDYTLVTMPPPSSGGLALLQTLGLLEHFPLGRAEGFGAGELSATHVTIEALRLAMGDRALWLGDPAATPVPVARLLDGHYLLQLVHAMDVEKRMPDSGSGLEPEGTHTTHFTVVDAEGNVVSCTSTVEAVWGSGILVPGYGFLLNNELTDFNRVPKAGPQDPGANDVRPGMRPRSSMAPTLVFRQGQWLLAYGSPGGSTIISTVLEMTLDLLDDHLTGDAAVRIPRFAVLNAAGETLVEPALSPGLIDALRAQGHRLILTPEPIGSVQLIGEDPVTHERWGAADPRREGTVIRF
ncbi:MAG: gamma-glutamyltransferase [Betaproteobacteria bacterium]|nr:gamma-glutamyltransferase [Betaproteobacteria bacterium]